MKINPLTDALVIIDIQNDFCPGGALAVAEGEAIIPGVIELAKQFSTVILTQDWHPKGHASFASSHQQPAFSTTTLAYGEQTLWPDHCVQGTPGAQFHESLRAAGVLDAACAVIRKGMNPAIDSYSAFFENDKVTPTGLAGYLRNRGIQTVFFVGLAYDFCVGYSALDAQEDFFDAIVVKDLTRAIGMPVGATTTIGLIEDQFTAAGVTVVNAADIQLTPKTPGLR